MTGWLEAVASNVAFATLAAAALLLAGRIPGVQTRPALRQALWMLVLLKLVTPQLFAPQWLRLDWPAATGKVASPASASVEPYSAIDSLSPESADEIGIDGELDWVAQANEPTATLERPFLVPSGEGYLSTTPSSTIGAIGWPPLVLSLSGGVSLIFVTRIARYNFRIRKLVSVASEATEDLQEILVDTAVRLDVSRFPRLLLAEGRFSPFLWAPLGSPAIVLPKALAAELSAEQLRFVLAHELAHYRRGDRWANLFAAAVGCLFWFHPAAWLARREIRAAQEICCDALVVESFADVKGSRRGYADTLLAALDFVHAPRSETAKPALAPWASAFGERPTLKRRFEMIANRRTTHRWSWTALAALLLACAALPAGLTFGQAPRDDAITAESADSATSEENEKSADIADAVPVQNVPGVTITIPAFTETQIAELFSFSGIAADSQAVETTSAEGQGEPESSLLTFDRGVPYRIVMQNGKELVGEVAKQNSQWKVVRLAGSDQTITINVDHVQSFQRESPGKNKGKKAAADRSAKEDGPTWEMMAELAAKHGAKLSAKKDAGDKSAEVDQAVAQAMHERDKAILAQQMAKEHAAHAKEAEARQHKHAADALIHAKLMEEKLVAQAAEQKAIRAKLDSVGPLLKEMKQQLAVKEKELDEARRIIAELKERLGAAEKNLEKNIENKPATPY